MLQYGSHANRIWIHVEGDFNPTFDANGYVNGTDSSNTLISDLRTYIQLAQQNNVLVFLCLWNGAVQRNPNVWGLVTDPNKLQSYLDVVLTPMVKGLSDLPALGGWEIINEPEGSVGIYSDSNRCFNTQNLQGTGAGWAGNTWHMKDIQRFINWQADTIHTVDPKALVTVGAWSELADTDQFGYTNYYTDSCLTQAGGRAKGYLDFYQIHSYAWQGQFNTNSPFKIQASQFQLDKPVVIGEFNANSSDGRNIQQLYQWGHDNGYNGAWAWTAEDQYNNWPGVQSLANEGDVKLVIGGGPTIADRCSCSDVAPDTTYTCVQQASWGKCNETWMDGYCCLSCRACQGCS